MEHQLKHKDILKAGEAAITKVDRAFFWEWDIGSALFFWRWPKNYQEIAQKGIALMLDSIPHQNMDTQPPYNDEEKQRKVKEKLDKMANKRYIAITYIKFAEAVMYMFHVAKGDNIRMVYDRSKPGLKDSI